MPNRLAASTSPYLQQHAENPVDWFEWGDDAFAEARRRGLPLLVSVGYSACHWCHVMAHESFEDDATATFMNEHFVNVKVDREERPDVDAVYMEATQAMTGQGGWPMTVFATPDGDPFYCGTYFPPVPAHGMPSFGQVLTALSHAWEDERDQVERSAQGLREVLAERGEARAAQTVETVVGDETVVSEDVVTGAGSGLGLDRRADVDAEVLQHAVAQLSRSFDPTRGGFGGAPKFPPSMVLEWLLRHHARTGSQEALLMVERTCEAMARGGLYDQLGGGFARYSVDADWVVPHFEKMLYDNALLLRVYTHWARSGNALAERVVTETADWLVRELGTPEGGFASALDADSPGPDGRAAEGAFYVWTPTQLDEVLGDDGPWTAQVLGVTQAGTFEHGTSVLRRTIDPDDPRRWAEVRARLLEARERRPRPARDDKVVAGWNGLAVAALAEAGDLLERPDWVDAARRAAEHLRTHLVDGRLARASRDGVVGSAAAVLEDYAHVADGWLTLLQVTGEARWLEEAGLLLEVVLEQFSADDGGFFDTAADQTDPVLARIRRPREIADGPTPAGQTAAAGALLTYAALTGSHRHRSAAVRALDVPLRLGAEVPRAAGWALAVAEALADGPREVAVVGPPEQRAALWRTAVRSAAPGAVRVAGEGGLPLLQDRPTIDGRATAYVCRGFVCDRPTTDPDELATQLAAP